MKKINFTDSELLNIVKTLSPRLNVRINKAGNITISDPTEKISNIHHVAAAFTQNYPYRPKEFRGYWTLYKTENSAFLWRHHDGNGYCYPLNMRGRKRIGKIHREIYDGQTFLWYNREWDMQKCMFNSVEAALDYFVKYLKKYRNINI